MLFAPLMVIGGVTVVVFSLTIAGFGENNDHSAVAVLLNLTLYVPNVFTFISFPVKEITCSGKQLYSLTVCAGGNGHTVLLPFVCVEALGDTESCIDSLILTKFITLKEYKWIRLVHIVHRSGVIRFPPVCIPNGMSEIGIPCIPDVCPISFILFSA